MFADHHHVNSFGDYPLVIRPGNAQIPQFLDDLAIIIHHHPSSIRDFPGVLVGFSTIFSPPRSGFETVLAVSAVCCWEPQNCHHGPNGAEFLPCPESLRLRGESGFMLKALAQGVVRTLERLERRDFWGDKQNFQTQRPRD